VTGKGSRQRTTDYDKYSDNYDRIFSEQPSYVSRTDIIGQNGNDGLHYKVEQVARAIAGEGADLPMMGKNKGKVRWELHIDQALRVLEVLDL